MIQMTPEREAKILEDAIAALEPNRLQGMVNTMVGSLGKLTAALSQFSAADRAGLLDEMHLRDVMWEMAGLQILIKQWQLAWGDLTDLEVDRLEMLERKLKTKEAR